MSDGIHDVRVEDFKALHTQSGIRIKIARKNYKKQPNVPKLGRCI
jgi:hypothetical protein